MTLPAFPERGVVLAVQPDATLWAVVNPVLDRHACQWHRPEREDLAGFNEVEREEGKVIESTLCSGACAIAVTCLLAPTDPGVGVSTQRGSGKPIGRR